MPLPGFTGLRWCSGSCRTGRRADGRGPHAGDRGQEVPSLMSYRSRVITGTQVGSRGDVCPQPAMSAARIQRHPGDLTGTTGAFGTGSKWSDPTMQTLEHYVPPGRALPCVEAGPDLYFSESPRELEVAKVLCRPCPLRAACLAGAKERPVPFKRPRGRPRKHPLPLHLDPEEAEAC